jgi:hypothetical protein
MPDLVAEQLPRLRENRLRGLDLGGNFIYPAYTGQSILNIPGSICQILGAPDFGAGPLHPEVIPPVGEDIRRVILVVMDAIGLQRLQRWMADGMIPIWNELAQAGRLAPLTSITPSTTSAALTSLWTGRSAAEHGIVGYELWLKEYSLVANMIAHSPITFRDDRGSLRRAGFMAKNFLPFTTFGTHLAAHGVQAYAFQHYSIIDSGLSEMFFKDVTTSGFASPTDLWVNLRQMIESRPNERQYIWVYWGEVDNFSHRYGPDDERTAAEFASFSAAFENLFLRRLSPAARQGTLLMLTADHGQITTRPDPTYELRNHPGLRRRLHMLPTGENRLMYLFVRPGQTEAVREYLQRIWPNQFSVIDPGYAVESGLFGPGSPHPFLADRLGDMVVIARGDAYLWWDARDNRMIGRHGGLHPDEMLVPFLTVRL